MIRSAELVGKHVRVFAQQGAIRGVHDPCLIAAEGTYDLFSTGPGPTRPEYKWLDQGAVISLTGVRTGEISSRLTIGARAGYGRSSSPAHPAASPGQRGQPA